MSCFSALLKEVHEFNRDHWHNSAILYVVVLAVNPKGSASAAKLQPPHASRNTKKAADGSNKFVRLDDHLFHLLLFIHPFHLPVLLFSRRLFL